MPSRWLQQKKIEQRRMRRAWAKPYSMKGSGPTKFPMAVTVGKDAEGNTVRSVTDMGIKGRARAAQAVLNPFLLERFKFNPNSSAAIYVRTRGLHTDLDPSSKELILAKMSHSPKRGTLQSETQYVMQVQHDRPTSHCRFYMSRENNFFIEIRVTETRGTVVLISAPYLDRRRALKAYSMNDILWDETHFLSSS